MLWGMAKNLKKKKKTARIPAGRRPQSRVNVKKPMYRGKGEERTVLHKSSDQLPQATPLPCSWYLNQRLSSCPKLLPASGASHTS